jgi:hypothetical protein
VSNYERRPLENSSHIKEWSSIDYAHSTIEGCSSWVNSESAEFIGEVYRVIGSDKSELSIAAFDDGDESGVSLFTLRQEGDGPAFSHHLWLTASAALLLSRVLAIAVKDLGVKHGKD